MTLVDIVNVHSKLVRWAWTPWTNSSEERKESWNCGGDRLLTQGGLCWFGTWAGLVVASLEGERRRKCRVKGTSPPRDPRKLLSGDCVKPES